MNTTTTHEDKWAALCAEHEGWLRTLASRYARRFPTVDFDDLLQEGRLAIGRALETYDETKGKFITYLTPWACAYMDVFCKDNCNIVRVSARRWYKPIAANLLAARAEAGPDDTEEDIHSSAIRRGIPTISSLDALAHPYDSDNPTTVGDTLPAPEPEPRDDEREGVLRQFLVGLNAEGREMFTRYFGLDGYEKHNLESLGDRAGKSRETIRLRIQARIAQFRRRAGIPSTGPARLRPG